MLKTFRVIKLSYAAGAVISLKICVEKKSTSMNKIDIIQLINLLKYLGAATLAVATIIIIFENCSWLNKFFFLKFILKYPRFWIFVTVLFFNFLMCSMSLEAASLSKLNIIESQVTRYNETLNINQPPLVLTEEQIKTILETCHSEGSIISAVTFLTSHHSDCLYFLKHFVEQNNIISGFLAPFFFSTSELAELVHNSPSIEVLLAAAQQRYDSYVIQYKEDLGILTSEFARYNDVWIASGLDPLILSNEFITNTLTNYGGNKGCILNAVHSHFESDKYYRTVISPYISIAYPIVLLVIYLTYKTVRIYFGL